MSSSRSGRRSNPCSWDPRIARSTVFPMARRPRAGATGREMAAEASEAVARRARTPPDSLGGHVDPWGPCAPRGGNAATECGNPDCSPSSMQWRGSTLNCTESPGHRVWLTKIEWQGDPLEGERLLSGRLVWEPRLQGELRPVSLR